MDLQHLNYIPDDCHSGQFQSNSRCSGLCPIHCFRAYQAAWKQNCRRACSSAAGNKRVVLTPEGERLLSYAQKMSNLENQIKVEVNHPEEPHGNLSIRIPETVSQYYLSALFGKYNAKFPAINLGLMDCVFFDLPEELQGRGG